MNLSKYLLNKGWGAEKDNLIDASVFRAIKELLKICSEKENVKYTLKASMVEIYNENIQDLLSPDVKTLDLKAQGTKIVLPGIREMPVASHEDVETIIALGEKNRTVASTKMNSTR